jgi:hypothetical protein
VKKNGTYKVNGGEYEDQFIEMDNLEWWRICDNCGTTSAPECNALRAFLIPNEQGWIAVQVPKSLGENPRDFDFCFTCAKKMSVADLVKYRNL